MKREIIWVRLSGGEVTVLAKTIQRNNESLPYAECWRWHKDGWIPDDECKHLIYTDNDMKWWELESVRGLTLEEAKRSVVEWDEEVLRRQAQTNK